MRGQDFWKHMREFDKKKEMERSSDFKVEEYKNYEFQTWTNPNGKPVLRVYKGKSGKPYSYYYYVKEEHRQEAIDRIKKSADNHEKRMEERRLARKNLVNPFEKGDILVSSWGYDQTNIDFYEILETTDKSVKIEKVGSETIGDNGPGGLLVVPNTSWRSGKIMTKRVGTHESVKITSYAYAHKWNGNPEYETHPMYGH